jgi:MFS family permease
VEKVKRKKLASPSGLKLLTNRAFAHVFWARAVSTLGDNLAPVAITFAVLEISGSPVHLGFVLGARTLSLIVFLLVGGVLADRMPRARLMVASDITRLVTQAVFAALLLSNSARIWHAVLLQLLNGAATALNRPAATALTRDVVGRNELQMANGLLSLRALLHKSSRRREIS